MAITLNLLVTRSIEPGVDELSGPLYRVNYEVTEAVDIPAKIFVLNVDEDYFEHVVTLWHLDNLPLTKEDAVDAGDTYYLNDSGYREYDSLERANEFEAYTTTRIQTMAHDYAVAQGVFPGTVEINITE